MVCPHTSLNKFICSQVESCCVRYSLFDMKHGLFFKFFEYATIGGNKGCGFIKFWRHALHNKQASLVQNLVLRHCLGPKWTGSWYLPIESHFSSFMSSMSCWFHAILYTISFQRLLCTLYSVYLQCLSSKSVNRHDSGVNGNLFKQRKISLEFHADKVISLFERDYYLKMLPDILREFGMLKR